MGTEAIGIAPEYVGIDCVIVCKKNSKLWEEFEQGNANLLEWRNKFNDPTDPAYTPRQLEAL